jgi:hypothetical protein
LTLEISYRKSGTCIHVLSNILSKKDFYNYELVSKIDNNNKRSVQINFKNMVRSLRKIRLEVNVQIMVPDTRNEYLFKEVGSLVKKGCKKINVRYVRSVLLWAFENLVAVVR